LPLSRHKSIATIRTKAKVVEDHEATDADETEMAAVEAAVEPAESLSTAGPMETVPIEAPTVKHPPTAISNAPPTPTCREAAPTAVTG
jgi:hypothetical protein